MKQLVRFVAVMGFSITPRSSRRLVLLAKLLVLAGIVWFMVSRVEIRDTAQIVATLVPTPGLQVETDTGLRPLRDAEVSVGDRFAVQPPPDDAPELRLVLSESPREDTLRVPQELVSPDGPVVLQPGLATAWGRIQLGRLWLPMAFFGCSTLLLGVRWGILLKAAGIDLPARSVARLHFLGLFFNTFVPGGAGGDVVKGYEAIRQTGKGIEVASTLVADRVLGLGVLILAGLAALLLDPRGSEQLFTTLIVLLVVLVVGTLVAFSPWVRRLLSSRQHLLWAPLRHAWQRVDASLQSFRKAPRLLVAAGLVGVATQLCSITAVWVLGNLAGIEAARFYDYLVMVPTAWVATAIPISPGGLGLMEVAFQEMMVRRGLGTASEGFMLGLLVRGSLVAWSLPGMPLWLLGGSRRGQKLDGAEGDEPQELESPAAMV